MFNPKFICMLLAALFAIVFPIVLLIVWKKKTGAKLLPFFVGAAVFFLFAIILERLFLGLVQQSPLIANFLSSNVVGAAIFGGLMAGLFEETGRFLAFKTVLKKLPETKNAVTYGVGHGGLEILLLLGQTYVLLLLALVTNGQGALSAYLPTAETLTLGFIGFAVLERVFAMALHISLSIFVFVAARDAKKLWLYPLAIWLHAVVDALAVFYQTGLLPLWATELCIGVFAGFLLFAAIRLYRRRENG